MNPKKLTIRIKSQEPSIQKPITPGEHKIIHTLNPLITKKHIVVIFLLVKRANQATNMPRLQREKLPDGITLADNL